MTAAAIVFLALCGLMAAFIIISVRAFQINPMLVRKIFRYMVIGSIGLVFSVAAVAIGLRLQDRNTSSFSRNYKAVKEIWGGEVRQSSPSFFYESMQREQYTDEKTGEFRFRDRLVHVPAGFRNHDVNTDIRSNVRQKGLMKFAGYVLQFNGSFEVSNPLPRSQKFFFSFPLPSGAGNVTDISVALNGSAFKDDPNYANGIDWEGTLSPGEKRVFTVTYKCQGTGSFYYGGGEGQGVEMDRFRVKLASDYRNTVIPDGAMAPSNSASDKTGSIITWESNKVIVNQSIGVRFDLLANYGELFSKIFFYSPLVIFLFLGFLVTFTVSRDIVLHPMHYLFISAGFFIFYILGSYLVSYIHIVPAVILSLAASSCITVYYSHIIGKSKELPRIVLLCLAVFQWFFSTAFFFPEHTGLLITLASICALVVLMRLTAATDWEKKW